MAFTKTPDQNTYQTKTIKLMKELDNRSSSLSYDQDYLNCFFDVIKNRTTQELDYNVVKRAGTETFYTLVSSNPRGMYYWEDQQRIYIALSDDIYVIDSTDGSLIDTLSAVFSTTSGNVGFCEFLYDDNTVVIVATDGTTLITATAGGTVATCADADLPTPHLPVPIFLDGYLFLVKDGTADLYNSDLNNPILWTAGNFLSSEMFPDTILHVAKLNNYMVTFGSSSIEYFWDAAIESGSPLQRNDTPVKLYGYLGGYAQHGNNIYFVGNSSAGTPTVYKLEDFKLKELDSSSLRKYFEVLDVASEGIFGNIVSFLGHDFYVVTIDGSRCYAMDLNTELWTRWGFQHSDQFNIRYATNIKQTTDYCSLITTTDSAVVMNFDPRVYNDLADTMLVRIVSDPETFDTYNQKIMYRLNIQADRPTTDSTVAVYWTDDDYQTYSTGVSLNLNQELPAIHQLGRFRKRAFKIEHSGNVPLRIKRLEVDINMGQH